MTNETRRGDWMQTFTGRQFWPIDPRASEVHIEDIAHALSMMCRYNGHCKVFYSVAEHSVLVSRALPDDLAMWGLLHDASEAYIADIVRPAKRFITGYHEAETRIMNAVCERFGLQPTMPSEVKRVDNAILADESAALLGPVPADWGLREPPLGVDIIGFSPWDAETLFINRYHEIVG
jgi:hypothetical protein